MTPNSPLILRLAMRLQHTASRLLSILALLGETRTHGSEEGDQEGGPEGREEGHEEGHQEEGVEEVSALRTSPPGVFRRHHLFHFLSDEIVVRKSLVHAAAGRAQVKLGRVSADSEVDFRAPTWTPARAQAAGFTQPGYVPARRHSQIP